MPTQLREMAKPSLPGFIVLGRRRGDNAYYGSVELSFAMDISKDRTQFHWTGTGYSILGKHEIDGREDAEDDVKRLKKTHPDIEWEIFDVHDELPVLIDWDEWRRANERDDTRLSGVRDKFGARNPRFFMID